VFLICIHIQVTSKTYSEVDIAWLQNKQVGMGQGNIPKNI
jgi:hypothetical protein